MVRPMRLRIAGGQLAFPRQDSAGGLSLFGLRRGALFRNERWPGSQQRGPGLLCVCGGPFSKMV